MGSCGAWWQEFARKHQQRRKVERQTRAARGAGDSEQDHWWRQVKSGKCRRRRAGVAGPRQGDACYDRSRYKGELLHHDGPLAWLPWRGFLRVQHPGRARGSSRGRDESCFGMGAVLSTGCDGAWAGVDHSACTKWSCGSYCRRNSAYFFHFKSALMDAGCFQAAKTNTANKMASW